MDVARALLRTLPISSALIVAGCAYNLGGSESGAVRKTTSDCASEALPDKFIVHWKDGHISYEEAKDSHALEENLLRPNADDISFTEHDFKIRLVQPTNVQTNPTPEPEEVNWGIQRISAPDAWALAQGDGITVAVIDSGVDITHPQLKNQLAINSGESGPDTNGRDKSNNGIDDDKNGLVDDVNGYDFNSKTAHVTDGSTGHGTHVSGVILGEHLPNAYVSGVAPKAKLLPLRFMSDDGVGDFPAALQAINYAVARGAKIINASWGGACSTDALRSAIAALETQGVMFVAAAGNGDPYTQIGFNLDGRPMYPAAYPNPGQITVGAMNMNNVMTGFSNFSPTLVHLLAPGWRIWSTFPGAGYARMDGTSMATPFVAGAAATVWSYRPKATVAQVKAAILTAVTPGSFTVSSGGYLNVRKALDEIAKNVAP